MARTSRRRVLDQDEFTIVERVDSDTPLDEYLDWTRGRGGFENVVRAWEEVYKAVALEQPCSIQMTFSLKPGAYARRITLAIQRLREIQRLRRRRRTSPQIEGPILLAMRLGYDVADAKWRFGYGALTRTGLRRRGVNRRAGKKSGKSPKRQQQRMEILRLADEIRAAHPYDRNHSTRWLAEKIRRLKKIPLSTVRTALYDHRRK